MKLFLRSLIYAALCLALCLYLPFLTGQIPQIGKALSPMHIPVLLCGFLCGWPYALAVGFIAPFLRFWDNFASLLNEAVQSCGKKRK